MVTGSRVPLFMETRLGRWLSGKVPPELPLRLRYGTHTFLAWVSVLGSLAFLPTETGEALAE